jgi:hypothetical protein
MYSAPFSIVLRDFMSTTMCKSWMGVEKFFGISTPVQLFHVINFRPRRAFSDPRQAVTRNCLVQHTAVKLVRPRLILTCHVILLYELYYYSSTCTLLQCHRLGERNDYLHAMKAFRFLPFGSLEWSAKLLQIYFMMFHHTKLNILFARVILRPGIFNCHYLRSSI